MQKTADKPNNTIPAPAAKSQPNEKTGLNVDEFVRIFDPNNQQTLLEKRG